jgi:O-methyltransferase
MIKSLLQIIRRKALNVACDTLLFRRYLYPNMDQEFFDLYPRFRDFTMTTLHRQYSLYEALNYVSNSKIDGDIVECGVYKGGSAMLCALTLLQANDLRHLWLYDTYAGMTAPTSHDESYLHSLETVKSIFANNDKESYNNWCFAGLDEVQRNMSRTLYPAEKISYVVGDVMKTIPDRLPEKIALLRLDTDFYDSTKHEMEHLFPRLVSGGVLLIDDYGYWKGSKLAVDEYIAKHNIRILLTRVDSSAKIGIKI